MRLRRSVPAVTLLLTLVACGGGDGDAEQAAPTSPATGAPSAAPSESTAPVAITATTLPKGDVTPGATFPEATQEAVCAPGYTSTAADRDVVEAAEVYTAYGLDATKGSADRKARNLDRLIPVSLGGNNSLQNVWPQPKEEVEAKEQVEAALKRKVCSGELPLEQAQQALAKDWIEAGRTLAQ